MSSLKKALDRDGLSDETKKIIGNTSYSAKIDAQGIAGSTLSEPVPNYISTPSEIVLSNKSNSWIVLGRDRPGSRLSGYGGRGDSGAASIDLVVGRNGSNVKQVDVSNQQLWTDSDFVNDSARIYISAKADIDDYLKLDGTNHKTRSAVGIKADHIRIVAREKIKLVTGTDDTNSQGGLINELSGIEINAGNNSESLQPMVLGSNVVSALSGIVNHIDSLAGIVDSLTMIIFDYNQQIATHFHISPFFAQCTTPSEVLIPEGTKANINLLQKVKRSILNLKINLGSFKITHLEQVGKNYVCSRRNKVN